MKAVSSFAVLGAAVLLCGGGSRELRGITILAATASASRPTSAERLPEPIPLEQDMEGERVRRLFGALYSSKKREDKKVLAFKLLQEARKEAAGPTRRYVLLREARDVAAEAGDIATVLEAIGKLNEQFTIDVLSMKAAALGRAVKGLRDPARARVAVEAYRELATDAIADFNYPIALDAAKQASALARKARDSSLKATAEEERVEIRKLRESLTVLSQNPDDAGARFAVGRFLCFFRDDWDRGLPSLAKAAEPVWKDLVEKELQPPDEATDQLVLAHGWWKLAGKQADPLQERVRERATYWYVKVLQGARGLERRSLEVHLAKTLKLDAPSLARDAIVLLTFDKDTYSRKGKRRLFRDVSGRGHHALAPNPEIVKTVSGRQGDALSCAEKTNLLLPKLREELSKNLRSITIAAWLRSGGKRSMSLIFDVGHYADRSVSLGEGGGSWFFNLPTERAEGRTITARPREQAGGGAPADSPTDEPAWHHVAGTWDGGEQRIYLDGILVEKTAHDGPPLSRRTITAATSSRLGSVDTHEARIGTQAKSYWRSTRYYRGLIDEFGIWTRALSPAEIRRLYLLGCTETPLPGG